MREDNLNPRILSNEACDKFNEISHFLAGCQCLIHPLGTAFINNAAKRLDISAFYLKVLISGKGGLDE